MTDEQLRAIAEKQSCQPEEFRDSVDMFFMLQSALRVLDQAGYVCVPKEPTDDMVAAGLNGTSPDEVWREMIAALSQEKGR